MNEEALKTMYSLAQKEGYKDSVDDFKNLLSSNTEALNTMYSLAQKEGYKDSIDDFSSLLGVKKKDTPQPYQPTSEEPTEVSKIPSEGIDLGVYPTAFTPKEDIEKVSEAGGLQGEKLKRKASEIALESTSTLRKQQKELETQIKGYQEVFNNSKTRLEDIQLEFSELNENLSNKYGLYYNQEAGAYDIPESMQPQFNQDVSVLNQLQKDFEAVQQGIKDNANAYRNSANRYAINKEALAQRGTPIGTFMTNLISEGVPTIVGGLGAFATDYLFGMSYAGMAGAGERKGMVEADEKTKKSILEDVQAVQDEMSNFLYDKIGVHAGSTKEYIEQQTEEGDFWNIAAGGVGTSIPAMLAAPLTGGASFYALTYDFADEAVKDIEGLSEDEKVAYKVTIAAITGALEKYGFSSLLKNKSITNSVVGRVLKRLPSVAKGKSANVSDDFINIVLDEGRIANATMNSARSEGIRTVNLRPAIDVGTRMATGFLAEAETGGLQSLAENSIEQSINLLKGEEVFDSKDWYDFTKEFLFDAAAEGVGGFAISGTIELFSKRGATQKQFDAAAKYLGDIRLEAIGAALEADVEAGNMTKEQAKATYDKIKQYKEDLARLPEDFPDSKKGEAVSLIQKRNGLQEKLGKVDESFKSKVQQEIDNINAKLADMGSVSDADIAAKEAEGAENTVRTFAERIAKGEDVSSAEDIQFYENNKQEVEDALRQMQEAEEVVTETVEEQPTEMEGEAVVEDVQPKSFVSKQEGVDEYDGIFSTDKTQGSGLTDPIQDDVFGRGYFFFKKDIDAEIVMMSPDEYIKRTEEGFGKTTSRTGVTEGQKKKINKAIDDGNKIDMPYLDYRGNKFSQEGRNRAIVAKERGETMIPVLIARDVTDEIKNAKIQEIISESEKVGMDIDSYLSKYFNEDAAIEIKNSETYKQYKQETDAVQEQTAGEVPVQPEAEVSGEMEEGVPDTEPQEATQEGKKPRVAKDKKGITSLMERVFGLNKSKSKAAARIYDIAIGTIAERAGITKEEAYRRFGFVKGGKNTLNELTSRGKALFQGGSGPSNFEKWKGDNELFYGSEVQDITSGKPVVVRVYHGTTNDFYEFDSSVKGNVEGHLGRVNYFTTDYQDASLNYQEEGADLTSRIDRRSEELESTLQYEYSSDFGVDLDLVKRDFGVTDEEIDSLYPDGVPEIIEPNELSYFIAEKELKGGDSKVLDVFVKLNNPIVIGNGATWFSVFEISESDIEDAAKEIAEENDVSIEEAKEDYDYEIRDRAIENSGYENGVLLALQKALSDNGYSPSKAQDILGDSFYDEEVDLSKIESSLRKAELYENEDGEIASSQVISDFFKNLGYDGIILTDVSDRFNMGLSPTTSHVHVFDDFSNQIKLADGTNTTFGKTRDIRFQSANGKASGAMMMGMDAMAIIYALTDPNVSTPLHELAHVYEHYLTEQERADIEAWSGHKSGTVEFSEAFARGFEKYLADGKAPNDKLQKLFDNFKKWLTEIYDGITGSEIDLELNDKMRGIYDAMLEGDKRSKSQKNRDKISRLIEANSSKLTGKNQVFKNFNPEDYPSLYGNAHNKDGYLKIIIDGLTSIQNDSEFGVEKARRIVRQLNEMNGLEKSRVKAKMSAKGFFKSKGKGGINISKYQHNASNFLKYIFAYSKNSDKVIVASGLRELDKQQEITRLMSNDYNTIMNDAIASIKGNATKVIPSSQIAAYIEQYIRQSNAVTEEQIMNAANLAVADFKHSIVKNNERSKNPDATKAIEENLPRFENVTSLDDLFSRMSKDEINFLNAVKKANNYKLEEKIKEAERAGIDFTPVSDYIHIAYRKGGVPDIEAVGDINDFIENYEIRQKKSGAIEQRVKQKQTLRGEDYIDFDFVGQQKSSYDKTNEAIFTNIPITMLSAFRDNPMLKSILGGDARGLSNRDLLIDTLIPQQIFQNAIQRNLYSKSGVGTRSVMRLLRWAQKSSVRLVMRSNPIQSIAQSMVYINTFANMTWLNPSIAFSVFSRTPLLVKQYASNQKKGVEGRKKFAWSELLNNAPEAARDIIETIIDQDAPIAFGSSTIRKIRRFNMKAQDAADEYAFKGMDRAAAQISFLHLYEAYMIKEGLTDAVPTDYEGYMQWWAEQGKNPNELAISFASNLVDKDQNASIPSRKTAVQMDKSIAGFVLKKIFLPFLGFKIKKVSSFGDDVRILSSLSKDVDIDDRMYALTRAFGTTVETVAYNSLKIYVANMLYGALGGILLSQFGLDDEDEDKLGKANTKAKKLVSRVLADVSGINIHPAINAAFAKGANFIYWEMMKRHNAMFADMYPSFDSFMRSGQEVVETPFTDDGIIGETGFLGIPVEATANILSMSEAALTGESYDYSKMINSLGASGTEKRYYTENEREAMAIIAAVSGLSIVAPASFSSAVRFSMQSAAQKMEGDDTEFKRVLREEYAGSFVDREDANKAFVNDFNKYVQELSEKNGIMGVTGAMPRFIGDIKSFTKTTLEKEIYKGLGYEKRQEFFHNIQSRNKTPRQVANIAFERYRKLDEKDREKFMNDFVNTTVAYNIGKEDRLIDIISQFVYYKSKYKDEK